MLQPVKISLEYLERVLPTELPYRGHTLKRMSIQLSESAALVMYQCNTFFDCPRHSHITGVMLFGSVSYKEHSVEALRQGLRRLYRNLEREVAFETARGCSILSDSDAGNRTRRRARALTAGG